VGEVVRVKRVTDRKKPIEKEREGITDQERSGTYF